MAGEELVFPDEAMEALETLRGLGFAVAAFTPEELEGVKAKYVEDAMVEAGWTAIEWLR